MAFNIHSNLMVGVCVFGAGGITVPILFIYLFKLFIYLFIYLFILWLCWVFVSVQGLSLVVASGGHS